MQYFLFPNRKFSVLAQLLAVLVTTATYAQNFTVSDGLLYDPAGNRFTPYGGNVNGANYADWGCPDYNWLNYESSVFFSEEGVNQILNGWRWNFLRANVSMKDHTWQGTTLADGWLSNPSRVEQHMDKLVEVYTSRDVVVMFEIHDFTCDNFNKASAQDLDNLEKFWKKVAAKYKNNPFVWFNILNEPGWYGDETKGVAVKYRDVHRRMIQAIRDQGATNVVVVDGSQCGQDAVHLNDDLIVENMSGILKWGPAIQEGFSNVLFNIHIYDAWAGSGNNNYAVDKFNDYIARVRAKGLCMPFIGECGSDGSPKHDWSTRFAYQVALQQHGLGLVAWHAVNGDRFNLCTNTGSRESQWATALDDLNNPTNLSELNGEWIWKGTHQDGYGALAQRYSPPSQEPSDQKLVVRARGTQGGEQITLRIDGQDAVTWTLTTSFSDYDYRGDWLGKSIQVAFINDGLNQDAIVDYIRFKDTVVQAEAQAVNTGVWQGQCGGSYSEWLHCSGYIAFDIKNNGARQTHQNAKQPISQASSQVLIYPNPSQDGSFTVQSSDVNNSQVSLFNLHGQRILVTQQSDQSHQMLIQPPVALPSGLYIVRVQTSSGAIARRPLLIE